MQRVYIETSIVSYLRQQQSGQVVAAARQFLTREWWANERSNYELVTSQYVIDEASDGDPDLARERLAALQGIPRLQLTEEIEKLVAEILDRRLLPSKAAVDALHIAIASFHRADVLLTWNCTHLANARIFPRVRTLLQGAGHWVPLICTPEELLGYDPND
jgi:hypothetical protein